jgi:hypothetical protein
MFLNHTKNLLLQFYPPESLHEEIVAIETLIIHRMMRWPDKLTWKFHFPNEASLLLSMKP